MMLDHLGHADAADAVVTAFEAVLSEGSVRTPDLGGASSGDEFADAVLEAISRPAEE